MISQRSHRCLRYLRHGARWEHQVRVGVRRLSLTEPSGERQCRFNRGASVPGRGRGAPGPLHRPGRHRGSERDDARPAGRLPRSGIAAADESRRQIEATTCTSATASVSLSLSLRPREIPARTSRRAPAEILSAASEELTQALAELRELASGIHPAAGPHAGRPPHGARRAHRARPIAPSRSRGFRQNACPKPWRSRSTTSSRKRERTSRNTRKPHEPPSSSSAWATAT